MASNIDDNEMLHCANTMFCEPRVMLCKTVFRVEYPLREAWCSLISIKQRRLGLFHFVPLTLHIGTSKKNKLSAQRGFVEIWLTRVLFHSETEPEYSIATCLGPCECSINGFYIHGIATFSRVWYYCRADSRLVPSQWETSLLTK